MQLNPKSKTLNSKQTQNPKLKIPKISSVIGEFCVLGLENLGLFRIYDLEFMVFSASVPRPPSPVPCTPYP